MSKLGRHRNSGGDLDALLMSSSHAIIIRVVMHSLLCVAALILGFSISREAVLIVVSFRLPYGSFFVKTTTSPHGHEVAILSFPRMQQRRTFSEPEFGVSHRTEEAESRFTHSKEPASTAFHSANLHAQQEKLAFTESKIALHHTTTHVPSIQLPPTTMAPSTKSSKSSRVPVGRHEILIRAWPHPDPLQTVIAHHLIQLVQEEQRHDHGRKQRKQLLIITVTYIDAFQLARLTCLAHTLRLVAGPLLWIVVEAGNTTNDTAAVLTSSMLAFHHLSLEEATPASTHFKERLRTEGLRYIHEHHLEGIVVFADDTITYNLNYFDEVQNVNWFGSFSAGGTKCIDTPGYECIEMQNGLSPLIPRGTNHSSIPNSLRSPCNSSTHIVYWHTTMSNETKQGNSSMESSDWSNIALNSKILWQKPNVSWIKGWNEVFKGNQSFVQSPLDLVKNATHMELLGKCGYI